MDRIKGLVAATAAVTLLAFAAAEASADQARITSEKAESERLIDLTIETSAYSEPTNVHVYLPTGYDANPKKRWPVTYSLAGMQNNYNSFAKLLKGEEMTKDYPSIVVSPDGNSGFWSDWFNNGNGGPPMYESFVIGELIDLIDARYRTIPDRAHRAIMGISMGGYGATSLAARHPDLFGSVATLSGAVDSNNPLIGSVMSLAPTFDGGAMDSIYGPRLTEEVRWRGSNPADLASNLRGMDIQVRTANGILNPGIGEGDQPADAVSCIIENGVYQGSISFHQELAELGVKHLWKDYGNGCHTPENFTREVVDTMAAFTRIFANPAPAPTRFQYKSIEPEFEIWGWKVEADPERALEFMTIETGQNTVALAGSGKATLTTPPHYRGLRKVDVGDSTARPDASGRVRFELDLGPAHTIQQYRPGASTGFVRRQVSFRPHAVIRILKAKRLKRGVKVCAKAIGGVVPKARIRAGKRRVQVKLTGKRTCRNLRTGKGKPKKVRIKGRDTYGHPAVAFRKVSRRG